MKSETDVQELFERDQRLQLHHELQPLRRLNATTHTKAQQQQAAKVAKVAKADRTCQVQLNPEQLSMLAQPENDDSNRTKGYDSSAGCTTESSRLETATGSHVTTIVRTAPATARISLKWPLVVQSTAPTAHRAPHRAMYFLQQRLCKLAQSNDQLVQSNGELARQRDAAVEMVARHAHRWQQLADGIQEENQWQMGRVEQEQELGEAEHQKRDHLAQTTSQALLEAQEQEEEDKAPVSMHTPNSIHPVPYPHTLGNPLRNSANSQLSLTRLSRDSTLSSEDEVEHQDEGGGKYEALPLVAHHTDTVQVSTPIQRERRCFTASKRPLHMKRVLTSTVYAHKGEVRGAVLMRP